MKEGRVSAQSRLVRLDALRGFALFGILAVNVWAFATGYYVSGIADPARDPVIQWVVSMFFETKFYLLFSFLFGYSFTLQLDAAAAPASPSGRGCCGGTSGSR